MKRHIGKATTTGSRKGCQSLAERCILLGSREGDLVLDPFLGSGTSAVAAARLGRRFVGCELNPEYVEMATRRLS